MSAFDNIIWAVDPFESNSKPIQRALKAIYTLAAAQTTLHALYANARAALYFEKGEVPKKSTFFKDAEKGLLAIAKMAKGLKVKSHVLIGRGGNDVDLLLTEAHKLKADVIVAAGHARGMLLRMVLGSFTEALLLKSKLPVLIVNPSANPTGKRVKRVLFPTDLGSATHSAFKQLLRYAKLGGWHITLLHVMDEPLVMVDSGDPYVTPLFVPINDSDSRTRQRSDLFDWQAEARKAHVTCTLKVPRKAIDPTKAVLSEATGERYELVVLSSTGKIKGIDLAGSRTRRIVRDAKIPLLVVKGKN
jgi:nucleotide-binding universal stress UspA family protein